MTCGHNGNPYVCKFCGLCCCCNHKYEERADGWWVKCKKAPWKKCLGPLSFHET